ncbi:NAD(P)-dependent oxidoreductase [Photorhabdus tasmaniensis]
MPRKIAVFGSSGFVGQHLIKTARSRGFEVTTIGRNSEADMRIELTDFEGIMNLPLQNYYSIIDVAAVNETQIHSNIKLAYDINVTRARAIVELAKRQNINNISYCSTFHVYGKQSGIIDKNSKYTPLNDYGLTHLLSEIIYRTFGDVYGKSVKIVRPTNIYGLPVLLNNFNRWTLVPYNFIKSAIDRKSIEIRTSGLQKRNFVDINNVVECLLSFSSITVDAIGKNTISIREFALLVSKELKELCGDIPVRWKESDPCNSVESELIFDNSESVVIESDNNSLCHFIRDFSELYIRRIE